MSHASSPSLQIENEKLLSFPKHSPEGLKVVPLKITQKCTVSNRHGGPPDHTNTLT